jgi:hypothetical protein
VFVRYISNVQVINHAMKCQEEFVAVLKGEAFEGFSRGLASAMLRGGEIFQNHDFSPYPLQNRCEPMKLRSD